MVLSCSRRLAGRMAGGKRVRCLRVLRMQKVDGMVVFGMGVQGWRHRCIYRGM